MNKRLLDKKIIVTGGSRGIGAGIVKRLFNEGAEIIIADIRENLAKQLIEELNTKKIIFIQTDLSKEDEIIISAGSLFISAEINKIIENEQRK